MLFDKTKKKAKMLVQMSQLASMQSLIPLLDKSNNLKNLSFTADDWDFFMLTACVYFGLETVISGQNDIGEKQFNKLHKNVIDELTAIDSQLPLALQDLNSYLIQMPREQFPQQSVGVGVWVMMNIKQSNELTESDFESCSLINSYIMQNLSNWW